MPGQSIAQMSAEDAREATDQLRQHLEAMWKMYVYLYENGAHAALGYGSWGEYCKKELDLSASYGYQLVEAGRVARQIQSARAHSVNPPKQYKQARALAKVIPEQRVQAWDMAQERYGEQPSEAQILAIVSPQPEPPNRNVCPTCNGTGYVVGKPSVGSGILPATLRRDHIEPFSKQRQSGKKR